MAGRLAFGYESDDERQGYAERLFWRRRQPISASTPKQDGDQRHQRQHRRRRRPVAVLPLHAVAADAHANGRRRQLNHAGLVHQLPGAGKLTSKHCNKQEHVYADPDEHSDYASLIYSCSGVSSSADGSAVMAHPPAAAPAQLPTGAGGCAHTSTMSSTDGSVQRQSPPAHQQHLASAGGSGGKPSPNNMLGRQSASDDDSGCALEEYAWVPQGLRPDLVHQYFSLLPDDKVPYVNSRGERWRIRQLLLQLPPQDTEPRYCRHASGKEGAALRRFAQHRKRDALGRATVRQVTLAANGSCCVHCGDPVRTGELAVFAGRADAAGSGERRRVWHPACFKCAACDELLVDLIYFHKGRAVYCGRHHAELFKPRCAACDELIFSDECTEAEGRSWHMRHFACTECDRQLGGRRYVVREHRPYCVGCYQTLYAERCSGCGGPIGVDQPHVSHDGRQWHAAEPHCFACAQCDVPLLGKPFLPRRGFIYCGAACCAAHKEQRDRLAPALEHAGGRSVDGDDAGPAAAGSDDSSPGPLVEPSPQLSVDGPVEPVPDSDEEIVMQLHGLSLPSCSDDSCQNVDTPRAPNNDSLEPAVRVRQADWRDRRRHKSVEPERPHNHLALASSLETLSEQEVRCDASERSYKRACNELPCSARSIVRGGRIETTFDVNCLHDEECGGSASPPLPPPPASCGGARDRRAGSLRAGDRPPSSSASSARRRVRIVAPPTASEQADLRQEFQQRGEGVMRGYNRPECRQRRGAAETGGCGRSHDACSTCSSDSDDSDPEYDSFLAQYYALQRRRHEAAAGSGSLAAAGRTASAGSLPKRLLAAQQTATAGGSAHNTPRRAANVPNRDNCIVS